MAVSIRTLEDPVFGDLTAYPDSTCTLPQALAPAGEAGDSCSCSIGTLISGDPGTHEDAVTVKGVDDSGSEVVDISSAQVLITDLPPILGVAKASDRTSVVEPGI
jgi:hypothetical protein